MNDLENHGLLQLPGLCYAKPLPRLLNSFLGMFVPAAAAVLDSRLYMHFWGAHNPHFSLQLWPLGTEWSREGGRNYNQGLGINWEVSAVGVTNPRQKSPQIIHEYLIWKAFPDKFPRKRVNQEIGSESWG